MSAQNLSLDYPLFGVTHQSFKKKIIKIASGGLIDHEGNAPVVRALRNVSFDLKPGDRVALVGHNGAGKSTLLRVLAGIYPPTSGSLQVEGRVISTLNISVGLELEATGYENIVTQGILFGLSRSEITKRIPDIASFTELGEYLDMPVRVYSSGMMTRLAFAVVTSLDVDILLMDEVIGTGDADFIRKAEARLSSFMSRAQIMVLASHNDDIVRRLCNKAILLSKGQVIKIGHIEDVFKDYYSGI